MVDTKDKKKKKQEEDTDPSEEMGGGEGLTKKGFRFLKRKTND